MRPALSRALTELSERLGWSELDQEDEHARWWLYEQAAKDDSLLDLLYEATVEEPDIFIKVGVVLRMVETQTSGVARSWIDLLPPDSRRLPEERMGDYQRLAAIGEFDSSWESPEQWSDWLQRRVSNLDGAPIDVLRILERAGRTKRVRNTARANIAAQGKNSR